MSFRPRSTENPRSFRLSSPRHLPIPRLSFDLRDGKRKGRRRVNSSPRSSGVPLSITPPRSPKSTEIIRTKPKPNPMLKPTGTSLALAFSTILFESSFYVIDFLLRRTEGKCFVSMLKSILDISVIEDKSVEVILQLISRAYDRIWPEKTLEQPLVKLFLKDEEKATPETAKLEFVFELPHFQEWMPVYFYAGMRSAQIIKLIDTQNNQIVKDLITQLEESSNHPESTTQLQEGTLLEHFLPWAFPGMSASQLITPLLHATVAIFQNVLDQCQDQLNFSLVTLFNEYTVLTKRRGLPSSEVNQFIFWAFVTPFFNLDSVYVMRRTQMRYATNNKYLMCFLVIRSVVLENNNLFQSISASDKQLLDQINFIYRSFVEQYHSTHDRELSDTVLHYCLTGDEQRATRLLAREFSTHLDVISEELLEDQGAYGDLLDHFAPFVCAGLISET